jgi:hypothetical protein
MDESVHDGQRGFEELLAKLSLEAKVSLLTGADYWSVRGHPGIGLRPIRTSDGPAGVRGPRWDERDTAVNVPAPAALAAGLHRGTSHRLPALRPGRTRTPLPVRARPGLHPLGIPRRRGRDSAIGWRSGRRSRRPCPAQERRYQAGM